jgi:signal transduction histidine kinase
MLEGDGRWSLRSLRGYKDWKDCEDIPRFPYDGITDSVIHRIRMTLKGLILPNWNYSPSQVDGRKIRSIHSWVILPIIASDNVIGFVQLGKNGKELVRPEQMQWAETLVLQASVAIQNAWLFEQVRSSSDRLQSLTRKLVEVQESERYHIARELHDEAGQSLSSLKLSLGRLEQDPDCPEHMRRRLVDLKHVTDGVMEELHRLAMDLRPVALDHLGLVAALDQYARHLKSNSLSVKFKAVGFEGNRLPPELENSLYRIVQEALTNVIRHAQARNVGILLEREAGKVKVFIEDDGIGFTPDWEIINDRMGLVGMRERCEMFGGSLTIESSAGLGTSIIVEVPDGGADSYHR